MTCSKMPSFNKTAILLAVTNLLSLILFLTFIKCLLDLSTNLILLVFTIIFSFSYAVSFILTLLSRTKPPPNSFIHLSVYLKDLPLALITLFYSTQTAYQQPFLNTHHYVLITTSCLLVVLTTLTNLLIEYNFQIHKMSKFLLHFTFRLFYIIGRLIGLTAFLSTFNDTPNSFIFVTITFSSYLVVSFIAYCPFCWLAVSHRPSKTTQTQQIFNTAFEALKLLVDFSSKPFKNKCLRLALFGIVQLAIQALFAYFWYFRAQAILEHDQSRTTLFSLLTKQRTRISLYNMHELEIKLSHRRLELISLIGCFAVAFLSYYAYSIQSCGSKSLKNPKNVIISEICDVEVARVATRQKDDRTDGFSIDTYKMSSSIATSMSSFMSPLLYDKGRINNLLTNKREMRCSTCSGSSLSTNSSQSSSSLMMSPMGPFYNLRRGLDYDTSSELNLSLRNDDDDSSCGDLMNDLEYLKTLQVTPSTWAVRVGARNLANEFTESNLRQFEAVEGHVAGKVDRWFVGVNQQQTGKHCNESFMV